MFIPYDVTDYANRAVGPDVHSPSAEHRKHKMLSRVHQKQGHTLLHTDVQPLFQS